MLNLIKITAVILVLHISTVITIQKYDRKFPKDFKWGVGSSSYQIEGGWKSNDKGESIWDFLTHNHPEKIADKSNADVSADSYHNWRRDVQMLKELKVNIYRFSISWPRILPTGHMNHVSTAGIKYYSNLIDELLHHNITPMVTIYHWDLPQRLQELGGWTNPELIDIYLDFARLVFEMYGDRVKIWTTFNEPWHVCEQAYGQDYMAPSYDYPGIPSYLCAHNLLKAHAEAYHMYQNEFKKSQNGTVGITLDVSWPEPKNNSAENREASERAMQFYIGWFGHPIFSRHGNYPTVMIERIRNLSKEQGFTKTRLPEFTREEILRIKGTADFFGINSYTSNLVTKNDHNNSAQFPVPSFLHDMGVVEVQDPNWTGSGSVWLKVYPKGMYNLLMWIKREYNNPIILVTENGVSDRGGLEDYARVDYFNLYLSAVLDAIEDGANVQGYIAWSLMDSYEWKAGFTEKFGLYHVNFNHPKRIRTPKVSALVYARICETNQIDWSYRPKLNNDQIRAIARVSDLQRNSGIKNVINQLLTCISLLTILLVKSVIY